MNEAIIAQTIMTGLILLIFLGFLIWGIKNSQFKNIEEPKYRMLENNLQSEETERKTDYLQKQNEGDSME